MKNNEMYTVKTFNELLRLTRGIDMESLGFFLGWRRHGYNSASCWEKDGTWFWEVIDEKGNTQLKSGTEEEITGLAWDKIATTLEAYEILSDDEWENLSNKPRMKDIASYDELLKAVEGIDMSWYGYCFGKETSGYKETCCWEEGGLWHFKRSDFITYTEEGPEEKIVRSMWRAIFSDPRLVGALKV